MVGLRITAYLLTSLVVSIGVRAAGPAATASSVCPRQGAVSDCTEGSSERVANNQSWLQPFEKQSVWRTPLLSRPQLDRNNTARVGAWLRKNFAKRPALAVHRFGVSVVVTGPGDPKFKWGSTLKTTTGWASNLGMFGRVPIPAGARPDLDSDGHLAVYDPSGEREWDFWQAHYDRRTKTWWTGGGAAVSTAIGSGIAPRTVVGATASNFPLLGGLVRPEELLAGSIDHALVFAQPVTAASYVCPATRSAGSSHDPLDLPSGAHLQLDPSLEVEGLRIPRWQKAIARAMQRFGMYLRDTSGAVTIYAENPNNRRVDPYRRLGFGRLVNFSDRFPWERMRVLAPNCARG